MTTSHKSWNGFAVIHSTAFKNITKQPNNRENDDDATNNEGGKDSFISAHITMNSAAEILAAHASNDSMLETIDNDDNGLLVGKEDLVC